MTPATDLHVMRQGDEIWIAGRVTDNREHSHHAMQVVWATEQAPARLSSGGTMWQAPTLLIEGRVPHTLELPAGLMCLIQQESPRARRLRARWLSETRVATAPPTTTPLTLDATSLLRRELAGDSEPEVGEAIDPRVSDVLSWLDTLENDANWSAVSLDGALSRVHLSKSRFLHLFSQHVGTPWRSYLIWRRALVAITLASKGASLTEAAHAAGYADSAHLSRQCLDLFGFSPSDIVNSSQFLQF
ncbi:helix-turn-helix transcriptional regulator [Lujinxingia vulgaris]|uniref:Helix-turn-helix transcriptional regulator n=1 Tax=Lujinxingia vulgaris TaxID=2600176 RepID=A0A5C6XM32_9DELT|nr:AraC family transcriptional regulator [Lujinxingia vulgaris]TXD41247.1 helix-turn-helix transcriptional regulator [Lujinxingia vulgaris]